MQPGEYHLHVWHCDREHRHCKILVRLLKSGTACTYQYYTDRLGRSELFAWFTKTLFKICIKTTQDKNRQKS